LWLTGASGYLGAHILNAAREWAVYPAYFSRPIAHPNALRLDLREADAVERALRTIRPDAVLHTACSNGSAEQIQAIAPAARHVADAARRSGARLVHVSSDIVFDGEQAPYADDARPRPLHDYGRAKAESEAIVAEHCPAAAIVRPSLIWGLAPLDRQTQWLVDGLKRGERVTLFTDEIRCPVHVADLSAALLELAARPDLAGPMNCGGAQALSRWAFGMKLLAALRLEPGPNVVASTVAESGLVRARDVTMISARAEKLLKTKLSGVDEVLKQLNHKAHEEKPSQSSQRKT
jgi:dTDP-4-dehydrorhamnose reductase